MVKAPKIAKQKAPPDQANDPNMEDVLMLVVDAIENKKGEHPVVLDLSEHLDYLDYMVVCTGQTELHTQAIANHIVDALAHYDIIPDGLNGHQHGDWILIDYGVLVVHVFLPAVRGFYRLEELWSAGKVVELK